MVLVKMAGLGVLISVTMTIRVAVMDVCRVVAVDVGSVRGNFAWAAMDLPSGEPVGGGTTPMEASGAVLAGLQDIGSVALGFESPLMVPVPPAGAEGWPELGRGRRGEGNRSWSAGAGSGSLATGLVQMAWVLQEIACHSNGLSVTTQVERWLDGSVQVLVWEAFVSGPGRPVRSEVTQHAADAAVAAETFASRWTSGTLADSDVTCAPDGSFNLAAASAIFARLAIDPRELVLPVAVYRTRPAA